MTDVAPYDLDVMLAARNSETSYSTRAKVGLLADSRLWMAHLTSSTITQLNIHGLALHLQMQTGGRVDVLQRLNFAVANATTTDLNTRTFAYIVANTPGTFGGNQPQPAANTPNLTPLEAAAQSDADIIIYLCSTNDRSQSFPIATTQANVMQALTRLRAAGKRVILLAEMPRGDTTYTSSRLTGQALSYQLRMAQWYRNIRIPGVYVVDPWPTLAVAGSTTGDALPGALFDGLHPGFPASYLIASQVAPVINTIVPPFNGMIPSSNTDLLSADNPSGSINGNPMLTDMSSTPSTASGVTITGLLPNGWVNVLNNLSGVTIAYGSTVVNGITYLSVTLSGTPTAASPSLDIATTISSSNRSALVAGDVLQTAGLVIVQAGASGVTFLTLDQVLTNTSNASLALYRAGGANVTGSILTTVPGGTSGQWGGLFATEAYTYDGTPLGNQTAIKYRIYPIQNTAVSATILLGPTAMRKVV